MALRLADHLEKENPDLAAVSYTLAIGRRAFSHRRSFVATDIAEAVIKLRESSKSTTAAISSPRVGFLFPGQGSQYINMGRELYETETTFSNAIDECATLLRSSLNHDIRVTLYPSNDQELAAAERDIHLTSLTQPCIFAVEFALAKLWISWGIKPSLLIGHSIGEYVAAVLAKTLTLEHALQTHAVTSTRKHARDTLLS
jgi:phthiocerol/phenolphthiocerol synthesis type-I polyketide synthase E